MAGAELEAELRELKTAGPLWQLKVNCLRYCRVVHLHHGLEDAMLFPALREADPDIGPVVDRLEADHRRVSDLLDAVEAAAARLTAADEDARADVVVTLDALHGHLLEHLDYEELRAGPVLRRLERIPGL
jgi:hemerythrin-like domain-containing protein